VKHLVVGAGASLAEALALGNACDVSPPLIRDFARKTWSNYSPHPILEAYLHELGHKTPPRDPRELFYELEEAGETSIERFMQFAWENWHRSAPASDPFPPAFTSGLLVNAGCGPDASSASTTRTQFWDDLLYHGVGAPLCGIMAQCFFENGKGWRDLKLSKTVAARLEPSDLVLNLNYDTVFELALSQVGRPFAYSPNPIPSDGVLVCKPHGSLNLVANETRFAFGQPEWLGMPQPQGFRSYSGIIPPRLNKSHSEHPIARMILAPARDRKPQTIAMWGVGLAESDLDLLDVYAEWSECAAAIDIVNPSPDVAARARALFRCEVRHFESVAEWIERAE
jgi:hypothetical protein